jgi:hypothetical protein
MLKNLTTRAATINPSSRNREPADGAPAACDRSGLRPASLRAHVDEIDVKRVVIDEVAGLPIGYCGKTLGLGQSKKFGMTSLGPFLQTVGLVLIVAHDTDASARMLERISKNYDPRQSSQVRLNNQSHLSQKTIDDVLSYLASRTAAVKEARSIRARRASLAGWEQKRNPQQVFQSQNGASIT